MPAISVILPTYNSVSTIQRAVRSILDQTFEDLELIIVDDGSQDGTRPLLESIRDHRIRIMAAEHQGVCQAANLGLKNAQSEWISRMDADDYAYPDKLSQQMNYLKKNDLDATGCQVRILGSGGGRLGSLRRYENWINTETLKPEAIHALRFVEFPIVNPTVVARRKYFEIGFRQTDMPEDYDLFLLAAQLGIRFGKVPEILFDWYDSPGRLTRTDDRYSGMAFDRCRRLHLLAGPLKNCMKVDLWGVGKTGKPWLRWLLAEGFQVRHCYDVSPRRVGELIHGCPVLHPDVFSAADGTPLLIAVGAKGARQQIDGFIRNQGHSPGGDAWFVA
ncbi:MAG: glycosyltransferase family 2 protein [Pirellulaceae bacterium]|jgi:glycosyltransferase involved in cell wall biosynthesis|nr:glycosyltransferase [Pirellulaceae bacterium]MDG2470746.1 glycosyltransferase family 2 protein [Pirellulaceae bacterium]